MTVARAWTFWTTVYLHTDHLGSPAAATDASANLQWREDYTPYGEARQTPWPNDDQSGFTGHIHDADTGLTYMQARYYDPVIGRFLSEDPVGFAQGGAGYFNRYAYVHNDPINGIDPTGEERVGLRIGGSLFYKVGVKFEATLTFDTTSKEIRLEGSAGAGVGARVGVTVAGVGGESRTDGHSVSAGVNVQASAAAEARPTPLGGEVGGKLNLVEGSASTENGLSGSGPNVEPIVAGGVGPVSVGSDGLVEAGLAVDAGVSATVEVEGAVTISLEDLFPD